MLGSARFGFALVPRGRRPPWAAEAGRRPPARCHGRRRGWDGEHRPPRRRRAAAERAAAGQAAAAPEGALTCLNDEGVVLAVSDLSFGEGNSGEWKNVGFNIDGLVSTAQSKDLCQPNSRRLRTSGLPGRQGRHRQLVRQEPAAPHPLALPELAGRGHQQGHLRRRRLHHAAEDAVPASRRATSPCSHEGLRRHGARLTPKFDGTDVWPVAPELLSDPRTRESSTVVFENSSVTGQTFDSGKKETFILTVPLNTMMGSTSLKLTLYAAQTTMTLSEDRKSATKGIISGVLNTEELVAECQEGRRAARPLRQTRCSQHRDPGPPGLGHHDRRHAGSGQDLRRHLHRSRLRDEGGADRRRRPRGASAGVTCP
jgi:hypothetical protein